MKTPVAFALLALLSGPLEAKTLKLATREWAPYASRSITNGGIATSVVEFIVEKMQGTLSYQVLPGKRAIAEAESGAYDGYFPATSCEAGFVASALIGNSRVGLISNKSGRTGFEWKKWEDLHGKRIGLVRGSDNGQRIKEMSEKGLLKIDEGNDDKNNLDKLLAGRLDLVVIDENSFYYMLATNPKFGGKFTFAKKLISEVPLYVCFREKNENRGLIDEFNATVKKTDLDDIPFQLF